MSSTELPAVGGGPGGERCERCRWWHYDLPGDGLVGAWAGDMRPLNLALLRLRGTIPAPDA